MAGCVRGFDNIIAKVPKVDVDFKPTRRPAEKVVKRVES